LKVSDDGVTHYAKLSGLYSFLDKYRKYGLHPADDLSLSTGFIPGTLSP
jgi:hypothetical protein